MNHEKLKKRILNEMLENEDTRLAREIFDELPSEMKIPANFHIIQAKIRLSKLVEEKEAAKP